MELEQAERLKENEDFKAFIQVLNDDVESMKEDLVNQPLEDVLRDQVRIQTIRGVTARLDNVIETLKPEAPATSQDDE